jgi:hypothetical protein
MCYISLEAENGLPGALRWGFAVHVRIGKRKNMEEQNCIMKCEGIGVWRRAADVTVR